MLQARDKSGKKTCTEVRNIESVLKQPCQFFVFIIFVAPVQVQCSSLYTLLLNCIPCPFIAYFFLISGYLALNSR